MVGVCYLFSGKFTRDQFLFLGFFWGVLFFFGGGGAHFTHLLKFEIPGSQPFSNSHKLISSLNPLSAVYVAETNWN